MVDNSSNKARMRQERLRAALKENLQKRKKQARVRRQTMDEPEQAGLGEDNISASKPPHHDD